MDEDDFNPADFPTIDEIEDEVTYQMTLLNSLDHTVPDRDAVAKQVHRRLDQLRTLRAMKSRVQLAKETPNTATAPLPNLPGVFSSGLDIAHDETLNATSPSSDFDAIDTPTSTTSDANSSTDMNDMRTSVVSSMSRKRKNSDEFHSYPGEPQKVLRAASSAYQLVWADPFADELDPVEAVRRREELVANRREQEERDAAFARQFAFELNQPSYDDAGPSSAPSRYTPVALPPGSQNAYSRLMGLKPVKKEEASDMLGTSSLGLYHGVDASYIDTSLSFTANIGQDDTKINTKSSPTSTSDGASAIIVSDDDNSDIEVIPADRFKPNLQSQQLSDARRAEVVATARRSPAALLMHGMDVGAMPPARAAALAAERRAQFLNERDRAVLQEALQAAGIHTNNTGVAANRPGYLQNGLPNISGSLGLSLSEHMRTLIASALISDPQYDPLARRANVPPISSDRHDYDLTLPQLSGMTMLDDAGNPLEPLDQRIADALQDPRKTDAELQALLTNITNDVEIKPEDREGTPEGLKYPLYEHQKLALTWLKQMEEGTNRGGILADDMGLGKTISALALILSRPSEDPSRKTTLIIGPVALIQQWKREINVKIKVGHKLTTFVAHGTGNKKNTFDALRKFDVVLTTYGTIGAEFSRWRKWHEERKHLPEHLRDETNLFPFIGRKSKWYRVILDEAQCIKNKATKAAEGCLNLDSNYRFCLSGTPMMNGVHELYSLIRFLRIRPYNNSEKFNHDFRWLFRKTISPPATKVRAMRKLQAIIKAIMLRRTKQSVIDGKPILSLPEKIEEIVHVVFDEDEQAFYTSLENKTQITFNKFVKAGTVGKNYSNILVLLLRLRQAACHPHMIMDYDEGVEAATSQEMEALAREMQPDVVRRIIEMVVAGFDCPVCLDAAPNPKLIMPCGHATCSECLVRIVATGGEAAVQQGDEAGTAKCPTCRGKLTVSKTVDLHAFKTVHMPELTAANAAGEDNNYVDSSDDSDSDDSDDDDDEGDDLQDFIVPDDADSGEEEDEEDDDLDAPLKAPAVDSAIADEIEENNDDDIPLRSTRAKGKGKAMTGGDDRSTSDLDMPTPKKPRVRGPHRTGGDNGKAKAEARRRGKGKSKGKEEAQDGDEDSDAELPELGEIGFDDAAPNMERYFKRSRKSRKAKRTGKDKKPKEGAPTLAKLKAESRKNKASRKAYMRYLKHHWVESAKTAKCLELLQNTEPGIKTIVFSQFTTLLDLMEVPISREMGAVYRRYDGSMTADARNKAVVEFADDPRVSVMLVSLKAGNAGLNLVMASQVIILDPFWNPYVEMQAVDRAHRIGQQKPVTVHRILVKGTVEDRIMELQEKKRRIIEGALDENASVEIGRLGAAELNFLFNGNDDDVERETRNRGPLTHSEVSIAVPSMSVERLVYGSGSGSGIRGRAITPDSEDSMF